MSCPCCSHSLSFTLCCSFSSISTLLHISLSYHRSQRHGAASKDFNTVAIIPVCQISGSDHHQTPSELCPSRLFQHIHVSHCTILKVINLIAWTNANIQIISDVKQLLLPINIMAVVSTTRYEVTNGYLYTLSRTDIKHSTSSIRGQIHTKISPHLINRHSVHSNFKMTVAHSTTVEMGYVHLLSYCF